MALQESKEYKEIANKLIDKFPQTLGHIALDKVLFVCESEKSPKKYADCRKVGWPWNYFSDMEYMIVFYKNNMLNMTQAQVNMLVMHELMHINEGGKLRNHDVQDFYELLSLAGLDWDTNQNLADILGDDEDVKPTPGKPMVLSDEDGEEPEI